MTNEDDSYPSTKQRESWIRHSYRLAEAAVAAGNHPFGACIVIDGEIVLEAENTVHTDKDPTRHAEMNVLHAASRLSEEQISKAILVTSTEPCAMCSGGLYWTGIKTMIYGCSAKELDRIAGPSLKCHSHEVFEGAVKPPIVFGPILEGEGSQQHEDYWPKLRTEGGGKQPHE
ncbi:MAG: nucleoside deaminase [Verrucomicrobiota bacterium]